jgi:nitrite reductase/ring-hydroxylating ferredoxin subunit
MSEAEDWVDLGAAEALAQLPVQRVLARRQPVALSYKDGVFGAVSNTCNHAGGPLGEGALDGDYLVCPWHHWKFHRVTGLGEPGFEADCVPALPVKVEAGRVLVNLAAATTRNRVPHPPHPLERELVRAPGKLRLAGIATTAMDEAYPRFSGSDHLLNHALEAATRRVPRPDSSR